MLEDLHCQSIVDIIILYHYYLGMYYMLSCLQVFLYLFKLKFLCILCLFLVLRLNVYMCGIFSSLIYVADFRCIAATVYLGKWGVTGAMIVVLIKMSCFSVFIRTATMITILFINTAIKIIVLTKISYFWVFIKMTTVLTKIQFLSLYWDCDNDHSPHKVS